MSSKKIIFFILVGLITIMIIGGILYLKNRTNQPSNIPEKLTIWITDGASEDYTTLADGFKEYAPEYKKTTITFEKKTTDPIRYRTLLLSTMADGVGPDIFMLGAGEDVVLQGKVEPIPSSVVDFSRFDKEYDDIFMDLITQDTSKDTTERYLLGVPLGFETMGMYYNKSLVRETPTTWNELDALYSNGISNNVLPTNLGLGPRYAPNAADTIGLFYRVNGDVDITKEKQSNTGISKYLQYRTAIAGSSQAYSNSYTPITTLEGIQETMNTKKQTSLDLFLNGEIGIIFGYPSLIKELEKSAKRVGVSNSASVILAEKVPTDDPTKGLKNLARYDIFAISKYTSQPQASAKFMEYLLTPDAEKRYLQSHPYMIAAQRSFWSAQKNTRLSDVLNRVTLDTFIPDPDEQISVFSYGLKAEFTNFLSDYIDNISNIDISNISDRISQDISCVIKTYSGEDLPPECEKM